MKCFPFLRILISSIGIICFSDFAYTDPVFKIQPSEISIPPAIEWGDYRRIIHPFPNWTLICDEDLNKKHKICNIKQEIAIENAGVIFSWSLVATHTGAPAMLLKVAPSFKVGDILKIEFSSGDKDYEVKIYECTPVNCLGFLPVGPIIKKHIDKGLDIWISLTSQELGLIRFKCPMEGIKEALKFI